MTTHILNQRDVDFLLYEFLDTESLLKRGRYFEHCREGFDVMIDVARGVSEFSPSRLSILSKNHVVGGTDDWVLNKTHQMSQFGTEGVFRREY